MHIDNPGRALPDNVVMFPGARRARTPQATASARSQAAAALSGAELNARLMILLGICISSAAALVSAVHFLQG